MTEQMEKIWHNGMKSWQEADNDDTSFTVSTHEGGRILISVQPRGIKHPVSVSIYTDKAGAEALADLLAQATGNSLYISDDDADSELA